MDEQNLSIDIQAGKLMDWLVSRRHCDKNWQQSLNEIKKNIANAILDMPENEQIAKLLQTTNLGYKCCVKIMELLKETEADTKNIFGRYSSTRIKDWQEILRLYEKNNVHLAELSQILVRNVQYEVPSLRKHIKKCHSLQQECDRKSENNVRLSNELNEKYKTHCKQFGIQGRDVRTELLLQLDQLPSMYASIEQLLPAILPIVEFYRAFRLFTLSAAARNDGTNEEKSMGSSAEGILPDLARLCTLGNVTSYEWRTGTKPSKVVNASAHTKEDITDDNAIDFGDNDIDFGDSAVSGDVINFGDDTVDFGDSPNDGATEGVASGEEALSAFDNPKIRNKIITDLYELTSFLSRRLYELKESDVCSARTVVNVFENAPQIIQSQQTTTQLGKMADTVQKLLDMLTNQHITNLFLMSNSPKYISRVSDALRQECMMVDRVIAKRADIEAERVKAELEERELEPKLERIQTQTKQLQKQIEAMISEKYNNRPVNLIIGNVGLH